MFTSSEKKCLLITLIFLASGSGIKAYRHAKVKIGPVEDSAFARVDSLDLQTVNDSVHAAIKIPPSSSDSLPVGSVKSGFKGKLSLNRAGAAELMSIRGIGEKTAQLIIQYRQDHGPFRDLKDLVQVKGIGEKKLEKITPFLIL